MTSLGVIVARLSSSRRAEVLLDALPIVASGWSGLDDVAPLLVGELADWCTIDLTTDEGRLWRVVAAHRDPSRERILWRLDELRPVGAPLEYGPTRAATGRPHLMRRVTDDDLRRIARDDEHLEVLRSLSVASLVSVPLVARGRPVGALTCGTDSADRLYDDADVDLLASLGQAVGLVIDSARLLDEALAADRREIASLAVLDSLFTNAPVGLAMTDADLRLVRVNEALAQMVGVGATALLGRTTTEAVGDVGRAAEPIQRRVIETGATVHDVQFRGRRAGGGAGHWAASFYPVREPDRGITGVGIIVIDVTDARLAAQRLDEERRFVDAVLHNLSDGVVACDVDGRLTLFNEAAAQMHKMSLTPSDRDRWPQDYRLYTADGARRLAPDEVPLARALDGEQVRDVEIVVERPDGERLTLRCSGQPLQDAGGRRLGAVVVQHDITERKRAEARLERLALHDPLTDLPNRALLLDRVRQALVRHERGARPPALLFVDLDRFKVINDNLGHDVGDRLLVAVARRLESVVRASDTVARLGGDEFVVLCEQLDDEREATNLSGRIAAALAEPDLLPDSGSDVVVTPSIGIAMASRGQRAEDLIRDADAAMYRAKERGRARHEVFDDVFRREAMRRWQVEVDLRRAIEADRLQLHYQPIVDLGTGQPAAAEALLRVEAADGTLAVPGDFLDVAEDSGLIVPIGTWAVVEACEQARRWYDATGAVLPVSVNLSARQLADRELVATLERALAVHDLPPGALSVEITESVLLEAADTMERVLDRLKEAGARLGIDDFGTGYSSLTYLRRFPVDFVKIDRSFVAGLGRDAEDTAIVTAVIGLASALGLSCVAEGVETPDQARRLRTLGCELGQGHHFARPVAAERWAAPAGGLTATRGA